MNLDLSSHLMASITAEMPNRQVDLAIAVEFRGLRGSLDLFEACGWGCIEASVTAVMACQDDYSPCRERNMFVLSIKE